ncbi:MAG: hypothetical protein PHS12_01305 [Candidatus Omnitrophica bacterium]|nr:hypothetical protein [Candidatus Omnitrophota bacterium]MDD4981383.1 hypothetical protein [Candidatus Omnitrophota bacterium]MDD5665532.1 hypothetical protein [Candidatus Omnitrophota bacterium]
MDNKKAMHPVSIFKEALGIWKSNWQSLAKLYLIVALPLLIINFFLKGPSSQSLLPWFFYTFINWLAGALLMTFLLIAIKERLLGGAVSIKGAICATKKYFWSYLLTSALYSIIVAGILFAGVTSSVWLYYFLIKPLGILLSLLAILPFVAVFLAAAVYWIIRLSLCAVVCIMEDSFAFAALKRSYQLVKPYVNAVVGEYCLALLMVILFFIPLWVAEYVRSGAASGVAADIYLFCANIVMQCIWVSIMVVLYKNLKEAAGS